MSWSTMTTVSPAVADGAQAIAQPHALGAVEAGGGFVEQDHPRTTGQGAGHGDQLPLSLGEFLDRAVDDRAQVQQVE